MYGKESLETGAKFNTLRKSDFLEKFAPTWLGRLLLLALVTFAANERYHTQSNFDNTLTQSKNTQVLELAALSTLQPGLTSRNTPPQASGHKEETETSYQISGELSQITGYYCEQIPGFPVGDGGGYCGTTASGELAQLGTAACGEKWPLGTKLNIEGFGQVTCLDRGYLGWDQVDIFFPTNRDLAQSSKPDWAKVEVVGQE